MDKIIFLLEEKWHTEGLPDAAEAVRAYRGYGFGTDLWILEEEERIAGEERIWDRPAAERDRTADSSDAKTGIDPAAFGTLCIADSERLLRQLADSGAAFCAYSHSGNTGEDLGTADYILMEPQWVDKDSLVKIWQRERNIPWTILETERCIVREFVPEDLDAIYELYDEEARRFLEPPSANRSLEREILTGYIRRVYRLCGYGHWAVICRETGELIGRMGFAFPPSKDQDLYSASAEEETGPDPSGEETSEPAGAADEPEAAGTAKVPKPTGAAAEADSVPSPDAMFGYLIRRDRRGQGIAREAGAAILQYGFEKLGFETIGADAAVSNEVSDKILRNFSFIPVAEVQNQRYYILHGKNWRNLQ